jgi:hypothetical protein
MRTETDVMRTDPPRTGTELPTPTGSSPARQFLAGATGAGRGTVELKLVRFCLCGNRRARPADVSPSAGAKAKLRTLVPSGLKWDGEGVGTVPTGLFFSRLLPESAQVGGLVALQGIEPWFDG